MTPKEKANELVHKYNNNEQLYYLITVYHAIECAIIAVDELLNDCDASSPFEEKRINYWQEVKEELIKLKQ